MPPKVAQSHSRTTGASGSHVGSSQSGSHALKPPSPKPYMTGTSMSMYPSTSGSLVSSNSALGNTAAPYAASFSKPVGVSRKAASPSTYPLSESGKGVQKNPNFIHQSQNFDHDFLPLSMSLTHRGDDGGEGLAATEHSNYEPNSSVFSSSMGTHSRSVVDAAKHYKIRELVIKQQEKYALQHGGHSAKYMPSPQYGSSSGKTSGERVPSVVLSTEAAKERDGSFMSCASSDSAHGTESAVSDLTSNDDCNNSDRMAHAGYLGSSHQSQGHHHPQNPHTHPSHPHPVSASQLIHELDPSRLSDEELLRVSSLFSAKLMRISQEIEKRPAILHALPAAQPQQSQQRPHSAVMSAVQSMMGKDRQSPAQLAASKHPLLAAQNPSPPPPHRSKGSSPLQSSTHSAMAPSKHQQQHHQQQQYQQQQDGGSAEREAVCVALRSQIPRSKSGGSESAFAAATSKQPHQTSRPASTNYSASSSSAAAAGLGLLSEPADDEELVRAFLESQRIAAAPGGRLLTPHSDPPGTTGTSSSNHGAPSRALSRGGAVPPNERMFALLGSSISPNMSPGAAQQYSRAATPSQFMGGGGGGLGNRSASYSPSEAPAHHPHPLPSRSGTPSQFNASRPHSRLSSSGNSNNAAAAAGHDDPYLELSTRGHSSARAVSSGSRLRRKASPPAESLLPCGSFTSLHPASAPSLTASTLRDIDAVHESKQSGGGGGGGGAHHAQGQASSSSLLLRVPTSRLLPRSSSSSSLHSFSSIDGLDSSGSLQDKDFDAIARAGGIDQLLSKHQQPFNMNSRIELVPSPFSAFDDRSQGSQSLNSNLSQNKQPQNRETRHKRTTSSSSSTAIRTSLADADFHSKPSTAFTSSSNIVAAKKR